MSDARRKNGREQAKEARLAVLVPSAKAVPMLEGIRKAEDAGLVIASNKRLDRAASQREELRERIADFSCWTGTMVAYEEPGKKLGKQSKTIAVIAEKP